MEELADTLKYPEFTAKCVRGLKYELCHLLHVCMKPFDWQGMAGAKVYNDKSETSQKKHGAEVGDKGVNDGGRQVEYHHWKNDPLERAHHMWLWWNIQRHILVWFTTAAHHIILVLTSSCFVERAFFSLLLPCKHATKQCWKKMLSIGFICVTVKIF